MDSQYIFGFQAKLTHVNIPTELNNPFSTGVPEVAKLAANEFQQFIQLESQNWNYDFTVKKGKMFGVLVVRNKDKSFGYLGTVSGKLPGQAKCPRFVPSVFDESIGDFFINKGMTELTELSKLIENITIQDEASKLVQERRLKSIALQQRLFENYYFTNLSGVEKNLVEIFENRFNKMPPSAAGECAAPKLLHYAIKNQLKPIAISEFWWGGPNKNEERSHGKFYPACQDRCRPILEYMLENLELYSTA